MVLCTVCGSANGGKAFCPKFDDNEPYSIRRNRFRCSDSDCIKEFSFTSDTVFHSRKLSFKEIMIAIWEELTELTNEKGVAASHLTRKLRIEYKPV